MKKTFRKTSAMLCAITVMASSMSFSGFVANAEGETVTSDYTLTIPATLAVANSGWNATAGISATGTLATGKKLVVTASSDDEFALVSGENKVNYKLAESGDNTTTYANATEKTSWEFTALSETAATQPMGIVVEDYSTKPAGNYQDTVTFTASVEDAVTTRTVTWTGRTMMDHSVYGEYQDGFTAEGVTLTTEGNSNQDVRDSNYFYGRNYNSFSVSDGKKFTKIVIESGDGDSELDDFPGATVTSHVLTAEEILEKHPGLPQDMVNDMVGDLRTDTITWTGNAETVRFKAWISSVEKITFTIE